MRYASSHGFRHATASILGNTLAILLVCVVASAGLAFISGSTVFTLLKWTGALYLIYLGVRIFRDKGGMWTARDALQTSYARIAAEAFALSLANPKILVFIAAFFPQFLIVGNNESLQFTVMTLTFAFFTSSTLVLYTSVSSWLFRKSEKSAWMNRVSGAALIGFGGYMLAQGV